MVNPTGSVEAVLRDGTLVSIRDVVAADRAQVIALFERMSAISIRHRFFCAKAALTEADLGYLAGGAKHVALAAIIQRETVPTIVGIGRYVTLSGSTAEVAFDVGDSDQGHGIGTLLLERLARRAREAGISMLCADVEIDNGQMLDVFAHSGYAIRDSLDDGIVHVDIAIAGARAVAGIALAG